MFDLRSIAVDPKTSVEGKWVRMPGTEAEFLIARASNRQAESARAVAQLPLYQEILDTLDNKELKEEVRQAKMKELDDKMMEANVEVMATHILLGWKGVGLDGKELPYSPETAAELLRNPAFYDFYKFVHEQSHASEHFRSEVEAVVTEQVKTSA